jgi:hypothetical protein
MASDLLEQLAELEVPPPPAGLDRQVHQRVNRSLLVLHLLDLGLRAMPWAMWHLSRALVAGLLRTAIGRWPDRPGGPEVKND